MIRVIQWATGSVGSAQLREVIDRPDLELVGLYLYGQSKLDIDAGVLVGRPPTGVAATDDADKPVRKVPSRDGAIPAAAHA
jgi:2,4-diaminopentanoate dehydrogenase